jgi:hypothetical protein
MELLHWQQLDANNNMRGKKLLGEESWNGDGDGDMKVDIVVLLFETLDFGKK